VTAVCTLEQPIAQKPGFGLSAEARTIRTFEEKVLPNHFCAPVSRKKGLSAKFYDLAQKWKAETRLMSSINQVCMNIHYQKIIGMGPEAVPYILHELEKEPDQWFWALKVITGAEPVSDEHLGDLEKMAEDWFIWARTHGYEW